MPILCIVLLSPTLPLASFISVILIVKNSMSALLLGGLVVPRLRNVPDEADMVRWES